MFRLSKLTDYAVVVLVRLSTAGHAGGTAMAPEHGSWPVQTSPGISAATGIPEPTVAKVLKAMAGKGLVASLRGAHGGYRLARPLATIPVAEVIEAIDGPIALTACVDGGDCESQCLCPMRGRWDPVNTAIRSALGAITLADMASAAMRPAFSFAEMPARATLDAHAEPAV